MYNKDYKADTDYLKFMCVSVFYCVTKTQAKIVNHKYSSWHEGSSYSILLYVH